ncbi:unnamed protein product [Porites evermanni]|uniref:Uncharacterized protein n=1 Tax=Porites evermanni TaxID=104178 RepID=A0ABN8M6V3_9CNID|nr:unnamed protein product [Porites evermanni]CAH3023505.1 unnamed protein product [Porites evermanni]
MRLVRLKQQVNTEQVPSRSTNCTVMYSEDENVLPRLRGRRADMNEERSELLKNITYLEDYKDLDNRKLNISSSSGGLSNTSSLAKPLSASLIIARCTELLSSPQSCIAGKFSTT